MRTFLKLIMLAGIAGIVFSCANREKRETKYPDGQLQEQFYVLETKDGSFVKDGDSKTWFPGGQPESVGQYKAGKQVGNLKRWYGNGQLKVDANFADDTLHGAFISWYGNGQKEIEGYYKMGKWDGAFTSWFTNGQKNVQGTYKAGIEIRENTVWYDNGNVRVKKYFNDDGNKNGVQTEWNSNGKKISEENFLDGIKEGELRYWTAEEKNFVYRNFKEGKDTNLPAVYKSSGNVTLELLPDETYKITYFDGGWFGSNKWKTVQGTFEVTRDWLELKKFKNYSLNNFKPDTISVGGRYDRIVFIKKTESNL